MTIVDSAQQVREAIVAIVDADIELLALFARPDSLIVPEGNRDIESGPSRIITYSSRTGIEPRTGYRILDIEFNAFAEDDAICGKAVTRLEYLFTTAGVTWNAFAARSLAVAPNMKSAPTQIRQGTLPDDTIDSTECRATLLCSLFIPANWSS